MLNRETADAPLPAIREEPSAAGVRPRTAVPDKPRWWPTLLTLACLGAAGYFSLPWLPRLIALTKGGREGAELAKPKQRIVRGPICTSGSIAC